MKKKSIVSCLLILLLAVGGCSSQSEEERPQLRLVSSGLQQASEKTFFHTFFKMFEAEYDVQVEVSFASSADLETAISDEIDGGEITSDVIMVDTAYMRPYVENNYMASLDFLNLAQPRRTFTSFFDGFTHREGVRYFAPVSFDVYLSMFNKKALPYMPDSVVVTRDGDLEITQIENITWQDIAEWAKAIEEATGEAHFGFPYGFVGSKLLYPLASIAKSMGEHAFPSFNDEGAQKAWGYLVDLHEDDALSYGSEYATVAHPTQLLNSEDLWMSFAHMGPLGSAYAANRSRYVLGPTPIDGLTGQGSSTAGSWAFGIVDGTANYESAQKWIEFISSPEINYLYCSNLGGVISPIEEVYDFLGNSATDEIMKIGLSIFEHDMDVTIVDTSSYTLWDEIKALYVELYEEMLESVPIDTAKLEEYQTLLDALKRDEDA